ncbi:methyltransferase domain-containing protein [Candidatus Latescibacterota bacterium]
MLQKDIDRFNKKDIENKRFWLRLGGMPEVNGSVVLDIGCGHGGLCIDLALSGAKKVIGLDINHQLIEFARENLRVNYPHLQDIVEFESINLKNYHNNLIYDYIFSKDSFEHIIHVEEMLNEMKKNPNPVERFMLDLVPFTTVLMEHIWKE